MNAATTQRTIIVGLGATGLSVARYLAARHEPFVIADSRREPPALDALQGALRDVELHLGAFDPALFASADRLIVSPGVAVSEPAVARARACGAEVLGDIELFARQVRAPVVAVTGSNGKSTVTALVAEMARGAGLNVRVGGNLGTAALDLLAATEPDLYVLELSSFQLETVESLAPAVAVVLNVSADHLDRYPNLGEYAAAKARIYRQAKVRVVNRNDPAVMAMSGQRQVLGFGLDEPGPEAFGLRVVDDRIWLARGSACLLAEDELKMAGRHNTANALAALALGTGVGLSEQAMLAALRWFSGLEHRCQWVATCAGVRWYNDSKATNVGATVAALEGLDGKIVLIAGGQAKGADFSPLREVLVHKARAVVLIGQDADLIEAGVGARIPCSHAADMREAVSVAAKLARAGDAVLLSPACASLDMYRDYRARGEAFVDAVQESRA